jgi:hypothetical protein
VKGHSIDRWSIRLTPLLLSLGFAVSAITVSATTNLVGAAVLGGARQGSTAVAIASLALFVLAVADLSLLGLHTPMWHRQTPRHFFYAHGAPKGALLWGLDTGLGFTTYRVTSIVWAAMLLSALGLLPWWAGAWYALGFTAPMSILVWVIPWRRDQRSGPRGEPAWLTEKLILSQPVARRAGSIALFAAALVCITLLPQARELLGSLARW